MLAALLVAIAAPYSHVMHVIFGYRYIVFSVFALLLFDRRLRSGDSRWMLGAGMLLQAGGCNPDINALAAGLATSITSNLITNLVFGAFNLGGF